MVSGSLSYELPEETTEEALILQLMEKLNRDETVNGILVQLPVPKHIDRGQSDSCDLAGKGCRRIPSGERWKA